MKKVIALCGLVLLAFSPMVHSADAPKATVEVWSKQCAKCHGKEGAGDTTMGKKLKVKDYTKDEDQKKFTDEESNKVIKEGKKEGSKTLMKGFGSTLSDKEIEALTKYIRTMQK